MSSTTHTPKPKIGLIPAISIVIANMVGVGVFTSLGYQVLGIQSVFALLFLWLTGGLIALFGALTYGELAVRFPRSGGEYNFLSRIYHPAVGFLSGWVSATVGFAAPMALFAMAFGNYFSKVFPSLSPMLLAILIIIILTLINTSSFKFGSSFQTLFTSLNILLILSITAAGITLANHEHFQLTFLNKDFDAVISSSFAESLVYVSFAYSGWNSATYVAGEIKNPISNLPKALFWGTSIVILLYLSLNFVFLYAIPMNDLLGLENKEEVAYLAAIKIFGTQGGTIISCIISIGLIAAINAIMIAGPRVTQVIGEDFPLFRIMATKNKSGSPVYATILQAIISLTLVVTLTFDQALTYIGLTLSLFTTLTVAGIFVVRWKYGKPTGHYSTWGYPVTPLLFIALEIWMMIYICMNKEKLIASVAGFLTILSGLIVFLLLRTTKKEFTTNENA